MTSLIMIPQDALLSKPHLVAKATVFKDAIRNWQNMGDQDYFLWQEFILCFGTVIEIESDNWLDNVLHLVMEKTLYAEVDLDINSIPKHQPGSNHHTMLHYQANGNQEPRGKRRVGKLHQVF
jgi:hypothetical protein